MAAVLPIFAGLSLAGTAVGAYGQIQAGDAQSKVAEANAQIAEANAAQSDISTADKLDQLARRTAITLGKQKAGFAKAGVKREGSALEVLTETALLHDKDAYRISEEGRLAREGFLFQAAQSRYAGKVAKQSSRIGAGTTILTGLGQMGLSYGYGKQNLITSTTPQTLGGTPVKTQ